MARRQSPSQRSQPPGECRREVSETTSDALDTFSALRGCNLRSHELRQSRRPSRARRPRAVGLQNVLRPIGLSFRYEISVFTLANCDAFEIAFASARPHGAVSAIQ